MMRRFRRALFAKGTLRSRPDCAMQPPVCDSERSATTNCGILCVLRRNHRMSMTNRHAWNKQLASLNEHIKGFQQKPDQAELEAAINAMHAYADAARSGGIEIPTRWMAV